MKIRRATAADAPFLAQISLIASRAQVGWGFYDVFFPGTDDEILSRLGAFASTNTPSFHHWSQRLVAEVDGVPAAAVAIYPETAESSAALGTAMSEIFSPAELAFIADRMKVMETCFCPHPADAWIIELVGTLPEFRRRGLVAALLDAALDEGRARGHTLASIMFEIDNDPAQRAYEHAGFVVVDERRHPDFEALIRSPGMRRAERSI